MKNKITKLILAFFLLQTSFLFAQEKVVNDYLQQYAQGKMNEVRSALPDLLVEYPNDPGVKLLLAVVLEDADKAVEIYKDIVQKYPESQWADDAYWRLIQYYVIKGDIDKADYELNNFRKRYPTSEFLSPATDVVRTGKSLLNQKIKQAELVAKQKEDEKTTNTEVSSKSTKSEAQPKEETQEETKSSGKYWGLQVSIFDTQENAEAEKAKFLNQRLRTTIEEKTVNGQKKFAVVIGNYSSMESAEAAKQIIQQQCGCKPIIYQK